MNNEEIIARINMYLLTWQPHWYKKLRHANTKFCCNAYRYNAIYSF